ncbi:hypothetical protein AgCh_012834 [Apium graveolens]
MYLLDYDVKYKKCRRISVVMLDNLTLKSDALEISTVSCSNLLENTENSLDICDANVVLMDVDQVLLEMPIYEEIDMNFEKNEENSKISISQSEDMKTRDLDKPNSLIENSETSTSQMFYGVLEISIRQHTYRDVKFSIDQMEISSGIRAKSESKQIQDLARMNTQKINSIKIPTFDKANYTLWKKKMLLFIRMANPLYIQIFKNGPFTPMVRVKETTDGDMVILAHYAPKDPYEYC